MSSNPQGKHKVKSGETFTVIAKQHGVTLKALQAANPQIKDINKISVGQLINVPASLAGDPAAAAIATVVPVVTTAPEPTATASASAAATTESAAFAAMDKRGKTKRLNPVFRARLVLLAEALARRGMQTLITDGLRTVEEQDELFKKGRRGIPGEKVVTNARGGKSNHNYGLAVDMYPVIGGKVFTDVKPTDSVEFRKLFLAIQDAAGEEAERLGLFWGARFSGLGDTPHIQLLPESVLKPAECLKIYNQNGKSLDAVWAEAEKHVKPLTA